MKKPVFKKSFSVDDIHELREYHYETTKDMTREERIEEINDKAEEFERETKGKKQKKLRYKTFKIRRGVKTPCLKFF